jgi:SAM-dependent methyltransferase
VGVAISTAQTAVSRAPFDALADRYDAVFTDSLIGRAQRELVWRQMDRCFRPGQRVLELNCGTGADAVHLGERGVEVLAFDVAPRMIEVARQRLRPLSSGARIELRVLSIEQIAELEREGPFDGALSNFAGLNCVEDLSSVARDLARLLAPGATALLCLAGRVVAWEWLWYLGHGEPRKALRRFQRGGTIARLAGGATVKVHYPSVRALARMFAPGFRLRRWRGVGVAVPPSYLEPFAKQFPGVLRWLERSDLWLSAVPLVRGLADHVLLEFKRVEA